MKFVMVLMMLLVPSVCAARDLTCLHQLFCGNFDIIVLAGQSNATSRGIVGGPAFKISNQHIYQMGRFGWTDHVVVPAKEPLQNLTKSSIGIGFALPFARYYRDNIMRVGREVLIIPAAYGDQRVTGTDAYWRLGGPGFRDVLERTEAASALPNSHVVAILWHQGESEASLPRFPMTVYRQTLTELLTDMRESVAPEAPILMGELSEQLRASLPIFDEINDTIRITAASLPNAAIVSSKGLAPIGPNKFSEKQDITHFSAYSQLIFGKRYFCEYAALIGAAIQGCNTVMSSTH